MLVWQYSDALRQEVNFALPDLKRFMPIVLDAYRPIAGGDLNGIDPNDHLYVSFIVISFCFEHGSHRRYIDLRHTDAWYNALS